MLVTSCLPLAASRYYLALTGSRDIAGLASILVAMSAHLTVFGTHTLVNSFVSTFTFLALASVVYELKKVTPAGFKRSVSLCEGQHGVQEATSSPSVKSKLNGLQDLGDSKNGSYITEESECQQEVHEFRNGKNEASLQSPNSEVPLAESPQKIKCSGIPEMAQQDRRLVQFLTGLTLALCVYIRPDSLLMSSTLTLLSVKPNLVLLALKQHLALLYFLGASLGMVLAVGDDVYFYGSFTVSPVNWVRFNVFSGNAPRLFGTSGMFFYIEEVFLHNFGMFCLSLIFVVYFLCLLCLHCYFILENIKFTARFLTQHGNAGNNCQKKGLVLELKDSSVISPCLCLVVLVVVFSFSGHKEQRFLHDALVLFYGVVASAAVTLLHLLRSRLWQVALLTSSLLLLLAHERYVFNSAKHWQYSYSEQNIDTNICLRYLSAQHDVTGLFLERNLHETGSYSLLHLNIPVLFLLGSEFLEFDNNSLVYQDRSTIPNIKAHKGYYSVMKVSDLIYKRNRDFLLKRIVESRYYNYAIVESSSRFHVPVFKEVFRSNDVVVLKRGYDPQTEARVSGAVAKVPYGGTNTTMAEYEGEVLKQLGNFYKAALRFETILARGKPEVNVLASLAFCYHRMGDDKGMSDVLRRCYGEFGREKCNVGDRGRVLQLGGGPDSMVV